MQLLLHEWLFACFPRLNNSLDFQNSNTLLEYRRCSIFLNLELWQAICDVSLITCDEILMCHWHNIKAVYRTSKYLPPNNSEFCGHNILFWWRLPANSFSTGWFFRYELAEACVRSSNHVSDLPNYIFVFKALLLT